MVPDLAATWGISGDGLAYRFTIRPGTRFSDGSPLRSTDVAATVAVVQAAGYPDAARAEAWKGVTIAVQDPATVTFTLPMARASFGATVADLPVVPSAALHGRSPADLERVAAAPMPTSGPMRVSSVDLSTVHLAANPYADPRPRIQSAELRLYATSDAAMRAFADGDVDAVEATTPTQRAAASARSGAHLYDSVTFRFVDLLLNARAPGLDDPAVRHAVAAAIDRSMLITRALHGMARPQADAIPAGILWVTGRTPEQPNPALSARALDAAGWRLPGPGQARSRSGVSLSYRLDVPDAVPLPAVAGEVARQLGEVGVGVDVHTVPPDRFEQDVLVPHAFQMAVADWDNGADPDISSFWRSNAAPPSGLNVSGVPADPFLDQALDSLATETDEALRQASAQRVDQRLADDAPAVFLYAPVVTFAVDGALRDVSVPAAGGTAARYQTLDAWWRPG